MPKVSIVIPAYNAMAFLPETLDSVLSQTWTDYEVVIVNDGSQDDILAWSQSINDARVRVYTQENQGLAGARNAGINQSEGQYIAFLDADDLWHPTKLEKQVAVLENSPEVGLVYTWVASINESGIKTGRVHRHEANGLVWSQLITHNIIECGSNAMVRRGCFETYGQFDRSLRSYVEDWDMWLRIAQTYAFAVVSEPLVLYRQHRESASQNWTAMEASFQQVINKAIASSPHADPSIEGQAWASAYRCLAWKPLQSRQKDISQAIAYQRKARKCYPAFRYSKEDLRLSLAIGLMRTLGPDSYTKVLNLGRTVRQRVLTGS